jgi:hypothetical protein
VEETQAERLDGARGEAEERVAQFAHNDYVFLLPFHEFFKRNYSYTKLCAQRTAENVRFPWEIPFVEPYGRDRSRLPLSECPLAITDFKRDIYN